jgi:chromosome segregation ATPase
MHPSFDSDRAIDNEVLAARIESLAAWIGDLESRVRTTELATIDEAGARELRRALEVIANHDPDLGEKLGDKVAVVTERLETLSSALATTASALAAKDGELAELQRRLEEHERRLELLSTTRAAGGAADGDELRRAIAELAARVEAIVEGDAARRRDLEELAARFASSDDHLGSLADDLQRRLEEIAGEARAPADERFAELDTRLRSLELSAAAAQESYAEIAQSRTQLEGLRMRLAAAERELAALSGSQRVADRIDDVARRLAALEPTVEHARLAYVPPLETTRTATELRALELRLERAEATERETRLEFLTHMERLAQRIEERLGALRDPGDAAIAPPTSPGAQVVPLHDAERTGTSSP